MNDFGAESPANILSHQSFSYGYQPKKHRSGKESNRANEPRLLEFNEIHGPDPSLRPA